MARRVGRERAFMILCSMDPFYTKPISHVAALWRSTDQVEELDADETPLVPREVLDDEKKFALHLVEGVARNLAEIDSKIKAAATHRWSMERMALVDRNILRLATYEVLFENTTAVRIILDEAIELAKKFGEHSTVDSKGLYSRHFVNGVLDKVVHLTGRSHELNAKREVSMRAKHGANRK